MATWGDPDVKPPIGTKVQWDDGPCGWTRNHYGMVVRHTKATIVIAVSPIRVIEHHGDASYSSTKIEPTWDMEDGSAGTVVAKFIRSGWDCWCVGKNRRHTSISPYIDGQVGIDNAYY
jgi:hypothetical protein